MVSPLESPTLVKLFYAAARVRYSFYGRRPSVGRANRIRTQFYLDLWQDAAAKCGASFRVLGNEVVEISLGNARALAQQNITQLDDPVTVTKAQSKPLVHRLLSERGLRMPAYCEFNANSLGKALAFMQRAERPCVVKPATGGGGSGITTGVETPLDLVRAAGSAYVFNRNLLIEEQLMGDVYRLLYLDGKLVDAVQKRSPFVIADGKRSVAELVQVENSLRLRSEARMAYCLLRVDLDMRRTLAKQGLKLSSVPKEGTQVTLKTVNNDSGEKENVYAGSMVCRSIIEDGAAAAEAVGVRLAGVDLITTNPGVPLAESGGGILEVNATPAYHHHYHRQGDPCPVAEKILPTLLSASQRRALAETVIS